MYFTGNEKSDRAANRAKLSMSRLSDKIITDMPLRAGVTINQ